MTVQILTRFGYLIPKLPKNYFFRAGLTASQRLLYK
jgi:hypothetical protein